MVKPYAAAFAFYTSLDYTIDVCHALGTRPVPSMDRQKGANMDIAVGDTIPTPKQQSKDKFEEKLNQFSSYYQVLD